MPCSHADFESSVLVKRLPTPGEGLLPCIVHIRVRCAAPDCPVQLTFALPPGVGLGMMQDAEKSADGTEARLRAYIPTGVVETPDTWVRTQTVTTDEGA